MAPVGQSQDPILALTYIQVNLRIRKDEALSLYSTQCYIIWGLSWNFAKLEFEKLIAVRLMYLAVLALITTICTF